LTTRILDENAETVADVPDGDCAVFDAAPGEHLFAASVDSQTGFAGSVGALRATLAAGRTYVVRVDKGWTRSGGMRSEEELVLELVAIRADDVPAVLSQLRVDPRVELLPKEGRPRTRADDIDLREAVVGIARLRAGGDDPALALPEPLRSLVPRTPPWSAARSTLQEDDGAPP